MHNPKKVNFKPYLKINLRKWIISQQNNGQNKRLNVNLKESEDNVDLTK